MRPFLRLYLISALSVFAMPVLAAAPEPPAGGALNPNMGAVKGNGALTDTSNRPIGAWSVDAVLKSGQFTGTAVFTVNGQTTTLPLRPTASYYENGRCTLKVEEGRTRAEISGRCTTKGIGGYLDAFIPAGDVYSVTGYASGDWTFGAPGKAPATGVVPTVRLTCAWMERVGGNVAGQDYQYELRASNMGFLQLSPNGTYRTANTAGKWVRGSGDTIKLTTGQFAGAVGHLQPDKSGQPAVYFEREENRNARGVHIVDPQRTSCTAKR